MRKKLLCLLIGVVLIMGNLIGCSGTNGGQNNETGTKETGSGIAETSEDPISLKWALWDLKTASYWKAVANAYMDQNPNVTIEMVDLGAADYMTVLGTELSGEGSDFDIITIKEVPGYATLVSKGVLDSLTDRITADQIDLSVYNGTTEQVTIDGQLYQMPFRTDFWVLYYNKDIYDAASAAYPSNDMTMEEFNDMVRSVAKTGFGDEQIYGSHYHTWRSAVQLFGFMDGKHTIHDGNYEFLKPYYEMVMNQQKDGICRTYVDINASQLHYSAAFSQGNTGTMNMGSWYITTLMDGLKAGEYDSELCGNWGVATYPHPDGVEAGTTLGSITGLSVPVVCDQKDAAWDFIKFACGVEGAEIIAKTGTFPAIMNDEIIEIITSVEGFPDDGTSKEALKTAQIYLEAPYGEHVSEINNILDTYHKDIMNGDISIDDGIKKMNADVTAIQ